MADFKTSKPSICCVQQYDETIKHEFDFIAITALRGKM